MGQESQTFIKVGTFALNMELAIIFALSDAHSKKTKQERRQFLNVRVISVVNNHDRTNAKARSTRLKSYLTTLIRGSHYPVLRSKSRRPTTWTPIETPIS